LLKCIIVMTVPVMAVLALVIALLAINGETSFAEIGSNPLSLFFSPGTGAGLGIMFMLVYLVMSLIVYAYVKLYLTTPGQNTFSVEEVFAEVKRNFWRALLSWLAVVVALAIMPLLVVGLYLVSENGGATFILGFILFFPFAYIWIPLWYFLLYVQVLENLPLDRAVKRAFAVVSDNWWPCLGFNLIIGILQSLMSYMFYLPLGIYWIVVFFTSSDWEAASENSALMAGFTTFYYVGSYLLQSISLVANTFQYHQLVEEKESIGLTTRIALIGQPVVQDWDEDY
jgi:hypothetical protein